MVFIRSEGVLANRAESFDVLRAEAQKFTDLDGPDPWILTPGVVANPACRYSQPFGYVGWAEQMLIRRLRRSTRRRSFWITVRTNSRLDRRDLPWLRRPRGDRTMEVTANLNMTGLMQRGHWNAERGQRRLSGLLRRIGVTNRTLNTMQHTQSKRLLRHLRDRPTGFPTGLVQIASQLCSKRRPASRGLRVI